MNKYYYIFYSFIFYSFAGWSIEVIYQLIKRKRFINRGFLYGPLCPMYGCTAVMFTLVLAFFKHNVVYIFFIGAILASIVEYITGYLLESLFHTKWWDYTDKKMNIRGYVCLQFSIYWGILSIIFVKVINPFAEKFVYFLINNINDLLYNILIVYLIIDITITINSLIAFRRVFGELQGTIAEIAENMEELLVRKLKKENIVSLQHRLNYLSDIRERLVKRVSVRHKYMLRAYPKISSKRFNAAIDDIRKRLDKKNK